ncbi:MAG: hypothetical protein Q9202_006965 [Teloschistes flavicans]
MSDLSISTTFLVLSDTHDIDPQTFIDNVWPAGIQRPKIDVVLHCGDMTRVGGISSFKQALETPGSIEAELKLVIAGNQDLELDKDFPAFCNDYGVADELEDHDEAVQLMKGSLAWDAGVSYLDQGTHAFNLTNGARFTLYASPYTPAFGNWAFMYPKHENRFNLLKGESLRGEDPNFIPDGVDIVMTHGPPKGVLDLSAAGHVGCDSLAKAINRVKPILHCFGHAHDGYGVATMDWRSNLAKKSFAITTRSPFPAEYSDAGTVEAVRWMGKRAIRWVGKRGEQTLAVNAAIETELGKPPNAPWLITLDLPPSNQTGN